MPELKKLNSILSIQEGITFIDLSETSSTENNLDWYVAFKSLIQSTLENSETKALILGVGRDSFKPNLDEEVLQVYGVLQDVCHLIANAGLPTIAAVQTAAFDSTLELIMHCQYRVAGQSSKIGFSVVKNGLIPGLGGTQLLPRLIGMEQALNMLHRSSEIEASELIGSSFFDELVEGDVSAAAFSLAQQKTNDNGSLQSLDEIKINLPHAQAFFDIARMNVAAIHKGNKAASTCIDCLEAAVLQPLAKGLKFEQVKFRQQLIEYKNNLLNSGEIV